ncbi:MAG: hypothetical protein HY791_23150 [Deltaproteobacteria bacterium]|nr:hypothetical protein [Deltaproteobacteria bacterium]
MSSVVWNSRVVCGPAREIRAEIECIATRVCRALRAGVLASVLLSSVGSAQMLVDQGPPQHRIIHKNTFVLRYNPLGLIYDGRFVYRYRLYESDSKVLRDNFLGLGLAPMVSPAWARIGPYLEVNPLTILTLSAMVHFVQYFGTSDLAQGFAGAQSDYSDNAIKANTSNPRATNGYEVTLGTSLQAKVSALVMRSQARMIYGSLELKPAERIYYDQTYDIGAPNNGWTFTNDLDVLYQGLENTLLAGARYTLTAPLYDPSKHFDPLDPERSADNSIHRVGPFVAFTFKSEDGAKLNTPTVFLLVQWYLKHRFRTGKDTSQALPLLGVGFQMTGDFLPIE